MKTVLALLFVAHLFFPANAFSQNEKNSNVNVLSHPSRVEIPDDLPFAIMETRTDKDLVTTEHLRFPAIDYQQAHFRSWQKCLRMTRDGGTKIAFNCVPGLIQSDNSAFLAGTRDGFKNALRIIQLQIDAGVSEEEIQRLCDAAYLQDPRALPPSRK